MSSDFRHFLIVLILLSIMTLGVLSCGKTEDEVKTSSSDNSSNSDNQTNFENQSIVVVGKSGTILTSNDGESL